MCVNAASAATTGNNSTVKKTFEGTGSVNVATTSTNPSIIDKGIYYWKTSKGYSCYLKWTDYKYYNYYVVVLYQYKYHTKYFSGKMILKNKNSGKFINDIYVTCTGNMWKSPSSSFLGWNEYADHFAIRKTGLYQINRDGELISSLVHPTISKPTVALLKTNPGWWCYAGDPPIWSAKIINSKTIYLYGQAHLPFKAGLGFKPYNVIIKSKTGTRINVASLSIPTVTGAATPYIIVKLASPLMDGYSYTIKLPGKFRYFVDHVTTKSVWVVLWYHGRTYPTN